MTTPASYESHEEYSTARRLALVVEYDGSNYKGFQFQPNHATIQGELERAINRVTNEEVRVRGASRTDSGVHAQGQVVDFDTAASLTTETWAKALNAHLPWDVKVLRCHQVPMGFSSRRNALARTYRYTILNRNAPSPLLHGRCAWVRHPLDVASMSQAAETLLGAHDFSPFTTPLPPGKSGVRRVDRWSVWREGDMVYIEAKANAFMTHQILRINGALVQVGKGRAPTTALKDILNGNIIANRPPPSLPAQGLCLMRVHYRDFPPAKES